MAKTLRVGMIGYGFMGKAHSNAWRQAPHFFPLKAKVEMHTISGRDRTREGSQEGAHDDADQHFQAIVAMAAYPRRGKGQLAVSKARILEFSKGFFSLRTGPEKAHHGIWH